MKNVKLLFILLAVVAISCSTDSEDAITQADLTLAPATKTAILTELETKLTAEKGEPVRYERSEVIQIENEFYLRAWSENYVSTTLLGKDGKGGLQSRGVSCTTSACSGSSTQCVPDGDRCTECNAGDCSRTTTGGGTGDGPVPF